MTVYELQDKTRKTEPCYFSHDNLKFFGETMSSMKVLKNTYTITDCYGIAHECVCLSKLSRKYPGGARRTYDYFDVNTWERIFPARS
jgi:hypothetical protein